MTRRANSAARRRRRARCPRRKQHEQPSAAGASDAVDAVQRAGEHDRAAVPGSGTVMTRRCTPSPSRSERTAAVVVAARPRRRRAWSTGMRTSSPRRRDRRGRPGARAGRSPSARPALGARLARQRRRAVAGRTPARDLHGSAACARSESSICPRSVAAHRRGSAPTQREHDRRADGERRRAAIRRRPSVTWSAQDVADAAHRVQQPRLAAGLRLAPQVADVDAERVRRRAEVVAPHALEDLRARQHLARVLEEQLEQVELGARELDRAARRGGPRARPGRARGRRSAARRARAASVRRSSARSRACSSRERERLDEVVVGARVEARRRGRRRRRAR